ncbi:site-specific integrase [Mesorhizobium sp.]|uniref:site-specific integrase n=4 Tax=unclassified Mesorhizobium TaxID=325217 RepID=UPI0025F8A436|nr:site-specific integrase [Mesorhizobium sp.]
MSKVSLFDYEPHAAATSLSLDELVAEFVAPYAMSSNHLHSIAARHLLCWLDLHKIALADVNNAVLERFGKHRCRCPGFKATPNNLRQYMSVTRMFMHLLEQRGLVPSKNRNDISQYIGHYASALSAKGYTPKTVKHMVFNARHFAYWTGNDGGWDDVNRHTIEQFALHDCSCPRAKSGPLMHGTVATRRRDAAKFLRYLVGQGVIASPPQQPVLDERLAAYCHWLATARALSPRGIEEKLREVKRWYTKICGEEVTCSTEVLRSILFDQAHRSTGSIGRTMSTLRSFVRFLIAKGECSPDRLAALNVGPTIPAKQVPRYIDRESIERIIASCDPSTRRGIRDRALIMLLARLGLRAGDIATLQLDDIDWDQGTIRVSGKSRRATRLPLPQDAGEAILAYIEHVRPTVPDRHLFLRMNAPHRSFARSSIVGWVVRKSIERAGLTGIPSGSHVFRHSLATAMLREGSTLEAIGTVLRHRKPDTTAIYAKLDFNKLGEVAQPWIGGAAC